MTATAQLLLDPEYRTIAGFGVLVRWHEGWEGGEGMRAKEGEGASGGG